MVQWFGHDAFPARTCIQSLVGELRSCKLHGRATNKTKSSIKLISYVCVSLCVCVFRSMNINVCIDLRAIITIRIKNKRITPQSCHVLFP